VKQLGEKIISTLKTESEPQQSFQIQSNCNATGAEQRSKGLPKKGFFIP
jgi:hypothetical protein